MKTLTALLVAATLLASISANAAQSLPAAEAAVDLVQRAISAFALAPQTTEAHWPGKSDREARADQMELMVFRNPGMIAETLELAAQADEGEVKSTVNDVSVKNLKKIGIEVKRNSVDSEHGEIVCEIKGFEAASRATTYQCNLGTGSAGSHYFQELLFKLLPNGKIIPLKISDIGVG